MERLRESGVNMSENGAPSTEDGLFWFLAGWNWSALIAGENGWISRSEFGELLQFGRKLHDETRAEMQKEGE